MLPNVSLVGIMSRIIRHYNANVSLAARLPFSSSITRKKKRKKKTKGGAFWRGGRPLCDRQKSRNRPQRARTQISQQEPAAAAAAGAPVTHHGCLLLLLWGLLLRHAPSVSSPSYVGVRLVPDYSAPWDVEKLPHDFCALSDAFLHQGRTGEREWKRVRFFFLNAGSSAGLWAHRAVCVATVADDRESSPRSLLARDRFLNLVGESLERGGLFRGVDPCMWVGLQRGEFHVG